MILRARHLDIVAMTRATDQAEAHVERVIALAAAMSEDIDKPARIAEGLCKTCHSLCKRCGGDQEMRVRRRGWPVFPKPEVQS